MPIIGHCIGPLTRGAGGVVKVDKDGLCRNSMFNDEVTKVSRIQFLTSKISHICQEICDIKSREKPQSNLANQNYVNTGLDEGCQGHSTLSSQRLLRAPG